jgi:hypothetical protein
MSFDGFDDNVDNVVVDDNNVFEKMGATVSSKKNCATNSRHDDLR